MPGTGTRPLKASANGEKSLRRRIPGLVHAARDAAHDQERHPFGAGGRAAPGLRRDQDVAAREELDAVHRQRPAAGEADVGLLLPRLRLVVLGADRAGREVDLREAERGRPSACRTNLNVPT